MPIVSLLVALLVFCLLVWGARAIMSAFRLGDPLRTVVMVAIVVIGVLFILQFLGLGGNYVHLR
jgi:hypothetical protein